MNQTINKNYHIENDVLFVAGDEAIRRLGEAGNKIGLNTQELIQISLDDKNKNQYIAQEILKYLDENGEYEDNIIHLNTGGMVIVDREKFADKSVEFTHVTRHPGTKAKLKFSGKKSTFPKFLVYGPEVLKKGIIDIEQATPNIKSARTLDELIGEEYEGLTFNNQFVNVYGNSFFRVNLPLSSDESGIRFSANSEETYIERFNPSECWAEHLKHVGRFQPRNVRQQLAMYNLANPNIEMHIISGGSGSGKSVVSYFAAINHILGNEKKRNVEGGVKDRIVLFKSNDIIGNKNREQGFLPGSKEEKDWPFMKSYKDAHDLCGLSNIPFEMMLQGFEKGQNGLGDLYLPSKHAPIEIENLIYARGRTFENCVVIVDEAQNYTPFEIKQLIERVGIGSVIYLIGDPMQVDNPSLSPNFNGFVYAANTFAKTGHPRMSIIEFDKNYRSQSAEIMRGVKAPRD